MAHGKIYGNVTETVGDTPLIYLNRLAADQVDVAAAEGRASARQLIIIERGSRR